MLKRVDEMVRFAASLCGDVEFSAEDAARSDVAFLNEVFAVAIAAGATTVNIPDTVGYTTPEEYAALIRAIREGGDRIPVVAISGQNADQLLLAEDYGATATLFKPVKRSELLRTVKGVARQTDEFWENVWL